VFDTVVDAYDARRPSYPAEVFDDLASLVGLTPRSRVLEIGCGTGLATVPLARTGASVLAVEIGPSLALVARDRVAAFPNVSIVTATFEEWPPLAEPFDVVLAAASWHWIDPTVRWQKAYEVLDAHGWLAILGHIVVRDPNEPEVYAETADLHEQYAPGHPGWGHPPTADEVIALADGASTSIAALELALGRAPDTSTTAALFRPPLIRWYHQEQWLDSLGYVDLMRTTSLYATLPGNVREPLLDAVAERIRTTMGDRAARRYLVALRLAQRC
jgi:SAM-dependent methyltransferase